MSKVKVSVVERDGTEIGWNEEISPSSDVLQAKGMASPNELELEDQTGTLNLSTIRARAEEVTPIAFDNSSTSFVFADESNGDFSISAGAIWEGLTKHVISSIDTSASDTFTYVYRDGIGGHTQSLGALSIDNLRYDDGSGTLAPVTASFFVNHWIYVDKIDQYFVVYGQDEHITLDEAADESAPVDIPSSFSLDTKLRIKVTQQQGASNFSSSETQTDRGPAGPAGPAGPVGNPGLSYKGLWSAGMYIPGDVVTYDPGTGIQGYVCTDVTTGNEEPTDTFYWDLLAPRGVDGSNGADGFGTNGFLLGTDWNSGTTYSIGQIVGWDGSLWFALIGSNLNNQPDTSPSDWYKMVSKGDPAGQIDHYSAYMSVDGGDTAVVQTVDYDVLVVESVAQPFTYNIGEFICNRTDVYLVVAKVGYEHTSGAGRNINDAWLEVDGTEVTGSRASEYIRSTSQQFGTNAISALIPLTLGETLRVRTMRQVGSDTDIISAARSNLVIQSATGKGADGEAGIPGTPGGGTFRGEYSVGDTYPLDDFVKHAGAVYISLQAGNTGNNPSSSPTFWSSVIEDGTDGVDGVPAGQIHYLNAGTFSSHAFTVSVEYLDIPWDNGLVQGPSDSFTYTGSELTCINADTYAVSAIVSMHNTLTDRPTFILSVQVDSGGGYTAVRQAYLTHVNDADCPSSAVVKAMVTLELGDKVKISVQHLSGSDVPRSQSILASGCDLSIHSVTGAGMDGAPGTPGNGNFQGDWNSVTSYAVNDLAIHNNSTDSGLWVCLIGNTNSEPTLINGDWKQTLKDGADGNDGANGTSVSFIEVSGLVEVSTTSTTYVPVDSLSFTTIDTGKYKLEFSSSGRGATGKSNQDSEYGLFVDGTLIQRSHRNFIFDSGTTSNDQRQVLHSQAVLNLTAGQVVSVRWKTSTETFIMNERSLILSRA